MKKIFYSILLLSIVLLSCNSDKRPQSFKLTIIETSDVHGAIFDYDFITNQKSEGSLSKVHTYVNALRDSGEVIIMDNGDILQGQPVVYYYNFVKDTVQHISSQVMNYMQYDVATIGNHDIETGHSVYDKIKDEFNFPWLAANAVNKENGEPYFEPYTIINRKGIKIAVLGLITPGVPNWLPEELWEGIVFQDMVESAKKWVPIIQEKEKPDLLIGLFHAGFDYTYGNLSYDTPKNENASVIVAEKVPGFDIIFVGHDHKTWNKKVTNIEGNKVLVLGPTGSARQLAKAEIVFTLNDNKTYNKHINGSIVSLKDYKPDQDFNKKFTNQFNQVKEFVSRKVGEIESPIDAYESIFGPSMFSDLIHEIQFDISGADISFTAPLSFKDKIEKGPMYVSDMFKLYRFENFLYTINLTGEEIDKYLEYSYGNWFNTMKSEDDNLLLFKKDENGNLIYSERYKSYSLQTQFYNFDAASGIRYVVNVDKPNGEKVDIISFTDGNAFHKDSIYKVAVNSYRGNGGGGHFTVGVGLSKEELVKRRVSSTENDLRYYMINWIEEKKSFNPQSKNEWTIEPHDWWVRAKNRDQKLLNKAL